ncbi:DUF1801 domain-containing protein [Saprospiraceae bacterium]|nr:DUF1801 domain-containing protein [Saprospiraceae bacterium]
MYKPIDVDDYIHYHEEWSDELSKIRSVLVASELDETIKWFIPTYTLNNKNVIGLGAFKDWVAIWFFNGSFLQDPYQVLVNAQDGKTKAQRQWRFRKGDQIDLQKLGLYIAEATDNQRKGLVIKVDRPARVLLTMHPLLATKLAESSIATTSWAAFSIAKKNEFIKYINEAKREATKATRVDKILPIIEHGHGLNDRYK